jgi:hypothetical protein
MDLSGGFVRRCWDLGLGFCGVDEFDVEVLRASSSDALRMTNFQTFSRLKLERCVQRA